MRALFWALGGVFLALGVLGIFLPVLPTTPFVLLSAACWARASPRLHAWLLAHPRFGPMVHAWQQHRAVPRHAKYLATLMMCASVTTLAWRLPHIWPALATGLLCAAVLLWLWRLPDA